MKQNLKMKRLHPSALTHARCHVICCVSGPAAAKPGPSKAGSTASFPAPVQQGELRKRISAQSLQTDRMTAIVGLSMAPPFLSLQSSLSTICTCKPFGDLEFGSFASVKFSAQTFWFLGRIPMMPWWCSGSESSLSEWNLRMRDHRHAGRWSHLVATPVDPATEGGQRWPSSSKGSRQRANSLL